MSGGSIRTVALSRIAGFELTPQLSISLSTLLFRCRASLLQFVYEAGIDAKLAHEPIVRRGLTVAWLNAAIQLSDDLSDGDCDYLDDPLRTGPVLLMILHQLYNAALADAGVSFHTLSRTAELLVSVGSGQYEELQTRRWTERKATLAALKLNGDQHAAFLEIVWAKTPLEKRASRVGRDIGWLVHVYTDIVSKDDRYYSLPKSDKERIRREARQLCAKLRRSDLLSVRRIASAVAGVL